ncbi:hypothetical protein F4692_002368 [Nocardioides cavernae]|uniref:WD40 repeat domain-containing protein n=1 Tax=Nocardioides cavernae TaxID=1921566 RepID=A0A7Y9H3G1_9ACTN|nr:hypothetical protein [Nocardioides cavernae]NYE37235.1 hypothetical protein [Nocardioides cavernae]
MNDRPLEEQVHDALHRTADPLDRSPLSVTDVRTRARRIQRRRTVAAGAAVAAVLAIAVPVGLSLVDPGQRSEVPPATQPPAPTIASGIVKVDPLSAEAVEQAPVPLLDVDGPALLQPDGSTVDLPGDYEALTPYGDGWIGVAINDAPGVPWSTIEILDADLEVVNDPVATGGLVVSPDGTRVAWSEYDGTQWRVRLADAAGGPASDHLVFPPGPEDHEVAPIGFVSDVEVAATQNDGRGVLSTFVGGGDSPGALPGPVEGRSASPVTGVVAGLKGSQDGRACSAVVEGVADAGATLWETCDHVLGPISPGGQYVLGSDPEADAYGSPTLTVLDAATGEEVVTFEAALPPRTAGGFATQLAWAGDDAVVARLFTGDDSAMMRLGLDGTVERIDVASSGASGLTVAEPG